jgi:N-glycosylase/DNA lyase
MSADRLRVPQFDVERRPNEIWKQKIFCVLSSQFNAQRAAVIADRIVREVPFFETSWPLRKIEEVCFEFLSRPGVSYRFPKLRAHQISMCWFPFAQIKDEYHEYFLSFGDEHRARTEIIELFPGIGMKQASMFLRNIGASKTLSVVDVHMIYFLRVCHGWDSDQLTPKRYLSAEEVLRRDADSYGLTLNTFDTVVWSAARAIKRAVHV